MHSQYTEGHHNVFGLANFVIFRNWCTTACHNLESKFCVQLRKTFSQIYDMIRKAYKDKAMSHSV